MIRHAVALVFFAVVALSVTSNLGAQENAGGQEQGPERRIAFVVGNETYSDGALPTAANDAGLIAQTLQAAGFEVVGARDLDAETLRQSYVEFQRRLTEAGPGTVAFVYLAGYGVQYGSDNYLVPIGANLTADTDIPVSAIRLADLMAPLDNLSLKARFFVVDAAYPPPFRLSGPPIAGGLALIEAGEGSLVAYNAAPGSVAPARKGNYGLYAQALAAELREGGQSVDDIFDHVRLRVSEESQGAEVPWDSAKVDPEFRFFERTPDAPPPVASADDETMSSRPLKDMPVKKAYSAALARDTADSYDEFATAFPKDPLAQRARMQLAARREALTWRRSTVTDSPAAYWTYLRRYPRGPHARSAQFRLRQLSAAIEPPETFTQVEYDIGAPPPEELRFLGRPAVDFSDPDYDLAPPPPPPVDWVPPMPAAFAELPPPPESDDLFALPAPAFLPIPVFYNPPRFVAVPRNNRFFGAPEGGRNGVALGARGIMNDIHRKPDREPGARGPLVPLPGAAQQRATVFERRGIRTREELRTARQRPGGIDGGPGGPAPRGAAPAQRLPGADRPLPPGANDGAGRRQTEPNRPDRGPDARGKAGADDRRGREPGPGTRGPDRQPNDARPPGGRREQGEPGAGRNRPENAKPGDRGPGAGNRPAERGPQSNNGDGRKQSGPPSSRDRGLGAERGPGGADRGRGGPADRPGGAGGRPPEAGPRGGAKDAPGGRGGERRDAGPGRRDGGPGAGGPGGPGAGGPPNRGEGMRNGGRGGPPAGPGARGGGPGGGMPPGAGGPRNRGGGPEGGPPAGQGPGMRGGGGGMPPGPGPGMRGGGPGPGPGMRGGGPGGGMPPGTGPGMRGGGPAGPGPGMRGGGPGGGMPPGPGGGGMRGGGPGGPGGGGPGGGGAGGGRGGPGGPGGSGHGGGGGSGGGGPGGGGGGRF